MPDIPVDAGADSATLLFVGDMMFDRTILAMSEEEGSDHVFSCMADYLKEFDLVVGNLEGPITEYQSVSRATVPGDAGNTTFTFPTSTAATLSRNNVRAVSLANNHIFDFGRKGVESTGRYLGESGVGYFGDPLDSSRMSLVRDIKGTTFAFVGFTEFYGINTVESVVAEVRRVRSLANQVVVFAHWGEEYSPVTDGQRVAARAFIDAGADLVVGAHPHIIQESESYRGGVIYYSLGNFIFDQYWDASVRIGLVLEMLVKDGSVSFSPRRVESSRTGGPCLI